MAPTVPTIPAVLDESDSFDQSAKKIWIIAVSLSLCIPCLAAIIVYFFRRYRRAKKAAAQPVTEGIPFEASHSQWLQNIRENAMHHQRIGSHDGGAISPKHVCSEHVARTQSTPALPTAHYNQPRSESPLRQHWTHAEGVSDKDVFEFPPPQEIHPAMRRDSTQ